MRRAVVITTVLLACAGSGWAGDIYVDINNGVCVSGSGQPDPYAVIYCSIQNAVADAAPGDTIHVAAGTYAAAVSVNKSLTLLGANAGVHPAVGTHPTETVGTRGAESILSNNFPAIVPSADNITIDGFMFTGDGGRIVDTYANANDFHLTNCIFDNDAVATTQGVIQFGGGSHTGMVLDFNLFQDEGDHTFYAGGGPYDGLTIEYNDFNVGGDSVFWAATALADAVIRGNEFDGTLGGTPGAGFCTINIGLGGNILIEDNWFHDLQYTPFQVGIIGGSIIGNTIERVYPYPGYWGSAFELWGGQYGTAVSTNVTITDNTIYYNDIPGAAEPTHGLRLRAPESGSGIDGSTIHVSHNSFLNGGARSDAYAVRHQGDPATAVDAEGNYWDTLAPGVIAGLMEGNVDFDPWCNADFSDCGFSSPVTDTYVDDDYIGLANDTEVDWPDGAGGGGHYIGYDAFATVQAGIDAVSGSTVHVAAGTYNETVTLDKSVQLLGAGCGTTMWRGSTITSRSLKIIRNSSAPANISVEISGFSFETENNQTIFADWSTGYTQVMTLDIHDNCFAHVNSRNPGNDFALWVDGANQAARGAQGAIRVYDNTFNIVTGGVLFENCRAVDVVDNAFTTTYEAVTFNYYSVSGDYGEQFVSGNTFAHHVVDWAFAINNWHDGGSYTILPSEVTHNEFLGPSFAYAVVYGVTGTQTTPHDFRIHDNAITSGTITVWGDYASQVLLNASGNWWGSAASPAARVTSPLVDYTPWLANGTDTSADLGFQGDFSELWVDDDSPQGGGGDGRITEALGMVTDSTINLAPGTYEEQVHITMNDLDLIGAGSGNNPAVDSIIQSPTALTWSFGSPANYPVVGFDGVTGGSLQNLRVDGLGRGNSNYRFQGVAFWNSGGDITDCVVTNIQDTPFSGAQHGVGIYAYNDTGGPYTINVTDTDVDEYQKNAYALSGTDLTVNLTDCTTTGKGATSTTAQNGIQIGYGAGGTIDGCTVSGNMYTGGSWAATGILLYGAAPVAVTDTAATDNQPSVYCIDTNATFTGLSVSHQDVAAGDALYAYVESGTLLGTGAKGLRPAPAPFEAPAAARSGSRAATSVSVTGSTFVGSDAADSWGIGVFGTSADSISLTMTNSTVRDWDYGVVAYDYGYGTSVSVTANLNQIYSNSTAGFYNDFSSAMDAKDNWWGAASGPYDPDGADEADNPPCYDPATMSNVDGGGNAVTDLNVDYCPWLGGAGTLTLEAADCQDDAYSGASGYQIEVELWMRDLTQNATGFQAFVAYDTAHLDYRGDLSNYTTSPFPLHITGIAAAEGTAGELTLDGSAYYSGGGTDADSLLATLVFDVIAPCDTTGAEFMAPAGPFVSELSFEGVPLPDGPGQYGHVHGG